MKTKIQEDKYMKKIISILVAMVILTSMASAYAATMILPEVILCYDDNGSLVYSKPAKFKNDYELPIEYKDTHKKVCNLFLGSFEEWIYEEQTGKDDADYVFELMSSLPEDKNYVISPLSLKMAMMMLANGAEGDTKAEITKAFNIADLDAYNAQAKEMIESLNANENGEVNIANSIWFNKDYYGTDNADFSDTFKKTITENYKGTAETVTNKNSVEAVNDWVEEQTKGKIKKLVPEANREYLAALVNAIYMKANWAEPFTKEATYKETFTDVNGKETEIDFMHQTEHFDYYENGDTKIVRMPYTNGLSMYIVLGDTKTFENDIENMTYSKVNLSIPKFKTEYSTELNDILKSMGAGRAFADNNSDFDSMMQNVPDPLKIDAALQKAIIEVDEKGTEAAAATAIMVGATMAFGEPEPIVEFKADKPFTYYIKDNASGETLFAGRYVKAE